MSDLVLIGEDREVEIRFACFPDFAIPVFLRTDPEWEELAPVWVMSEMEGGWRPRIFGQRILVSMFDACPHPFLRPHEYRLWNEHVILRMMRGLRGSGILTISHRIGWPWHLGLSWSKYPLQPDTRGVTEKPPVWWGVPDIWGELEGGFPALHRRVHEEFHRNDMNWERQVARRLRLIEEGLIEPQRRMPDAELADFRQRIEHILDEAFEEERQDARLLPRRNP